MSTSRAIGAVAGYAAMALAIAVGVAGFMVADVQLALARIDADDSATWPNMAPQVRYFSVSVRCTKKGRAKAIALNRV